MADKGKKNANPDPITGEPGSHPVGVGVGTAAGASAGAAIASPAGPIGAAAGAIIGGIAGAMAGRGIAEDINPTDEAAYWRENFYSRPYVDRDASFDTYSSAYESGYMGYAKYGGERTFDEAEGELQREYETTGDKSLRWDTARHAARDAWDRLQMKYTHTGEERGREDH